MRRIDKQNYYLDIAESVLKRGTCLRRNYGAIIVKNDEIVATGYTGAPRGRKNCDEMGFCMREHLQIPSGQRYELCRSVHAEANAIINAAREQMIGATLYLACLHYETGELVADTLPCSMCRRLIINAGIRTVVVRDSRESYRTIDVAGAWIEKDESLSPGEGY